MRDAIIRMKPIWEGLSHDGGILFSATYPEKGVKFINKGIGNRVRDLKERWTTDCIDRKPHGIDIDRDK